ncbi:hypothetical protein ASF23_07925 [Curtobacterium sp. Leaf261]|nr:hypothetical protein ASF23_07925 [Curtobacterium sp. Leaf261]
MTDGRDQFRLVPRNDSPAEAPPDRWPAVRAALDGLRTECLAIVHAGRTEFDREHSLTYRAAEAVIIHFDDLLGRLPAEEAVRLPDDLSPAAVRRTRNILSHDYRSAKRSIVWDVVADRIPSVIDTLLG